jgi:hypothetical protein
MNEQSQEVTTLQSLLNYYRNKCSVIEYEFILYKTKVESKIEEFEKRLDRAETAKSKANSKEKGISDAKT